MILLDSDGMTAAAAARELAAAMPQVKSVLRVDGGAVNWKAEDLPWKETPQLPALPSFKLPSISLPSSSGVARCACGAFSMMVLHAMYACDVRAGADAAAPVRNRPRMPRSLRCHGKPP